MPYTDVLNVVLPTFITIVIGYVLGKIIKIDMTGVVDVIFYIGLPALAFTSILSHHISLIGGGPDFCCGPDCDFRLRIAGLADIQNKKGKT